MSDDNQYDLFKPKKFGYQRKELDFKLHLSDQILHINPPEPTFWIFPEVYLLQSIGNLDTYRFTGKLIDIVDRKSYLTQTPEPFSARSSGLSIYTDNTPDPFTHNSQVAMGVKGFGFSGTGQLFVQGTADRPGSSNFNSFQFNIVPGDIPLLVVKNMTLAPQVGIDMKSGAPSLGLQLNVKDSLFQSVNVGVNNLSWDWKRKIRADSVQVVFTFTIPGS